MQFLSNKMVRKCEQYGKDFLAHLSRYSRARATRDAESNPELQALARMAEVIFCLELGIDAKELLWVLLQEDQPLATTGRTTIISATLHNYGAATRDKVRIQFLVGRARTPDNPADFTLATMPRRVAEVGDRHAAMDSQPCSLTGLLELSERHGREGRGDAPWPPHFRKQAGEPARVQPSRRRAGRRPRGGAGEQGAADAVSHGAAAVSARRGRGRKGRREQGDEAVGQGSVESAGLPDAGRRITSRGRKLEPLNRVLSSRLSSSRK